MSQAPPVPVPPGNLFAWRRALASEQGPKSTTRLVLLTLSLHMNREGGSCFPSTATLATETGLSERAVCTHLDLAEKAGWIIKEIAGRSGKGWARHGYQAAMPAPVAEALKEVQHEGTEGGSVPEAKALNVVPKALKEVQSISSENTPRDDDARQRAREALAAWDIQVPAIIAEAEDRAGEGRPGAQLVRSAHRLGLTGIPPPESVAALDALDAPAAAALAVAVLRTGRAKSPEGRRDYLLSLAASLHDHDTERRYADAHPDAAPQPGGGGGPVGTARTEAGRANGGRPGGGTGSALAVRGAARPADGPRLSASERRGQFGPDRASELVRAALAIGGGDAGDDREGDRE